MGTGMSAIIGGVSALTSLFSMGTSTVTQMAMARQQLHQQQAQVQCPVGTTQQTVIMQDGSRGTICYAQPSTTTTTR